MVINGSDYSENIQRCHDYIKALEEERRKIQVFRRELPLCLDLVTQAIEKCRQQLSGTTTTEEKNLNSECSEQTSSHVPVFEEFMPMKRACSDSDGEEEESGGGGDKLCKKSDWLRSVQLWNQPAAPADPPSNNKEGLPEKFSGGGAFHAFKKEGGGVAAAPASTSSTAENGGGGGEKREKKEALRKARRCWSPELHRRFLQALQQLGGSHATPKQIRELMKVDGLTNDEVKSHLQKYRLHTRRPSSSNQNNNAQTPQFVVVGGLWVPPEYASMAATAATSAEAPAGGGGAANAPASQSNDGGRSSSKGGGGGAQSCSAATSSSAHTATAVPPAC